MIRLALVLMLAPAVAAAQTMCGPRLDMLDGFKKQYGEVPAAVGLADNGVAIEIVVSPTGTWTLMAVRPDGKACMITSGTEWKSVENKAGGL